jgi:hypothetical protein
MTAPASPHGTPLQALFDASPAVEVHTSAAAVTAFVCGVGALLTAPFTITFALALALAVLGCGTSLAGVVATSRPRVAGRALAPAGLFLSVVALALLGLRYASLDTAFGDHWLPVLTHLLERLNTDLRRS